MRIILVVLVCTLSFLSRGVAQPVLNPSIGLTIAPSDSDSICTPGPYNGNVVFAGLPFGQHASDFTLFDDNGDSVSLGQILALGKPVLLIAGSYTCPIFRSNVPTIDSVVKRYGKLISTYIVYTAEAHPIIDNSPYLGGDPYSDEQNFLDGVQFTQPRTYGERRAIEHAMVASMQINAPILFDAPCNQWLETYGPAPNNAYVIDPKGVIRYKHPWFNLDGQNIFWDLDELLRIDTAKQRLDTGRFTFALTSNDTVFAPTGSTTSVEGVLTNQTDAAATILISRRNSTKMPSGWQSALCTNICLTPEMDSTVVRLEPHSSVEVRVYFYVGDNEGVGRVYVHFYNQSVPDDSVRQRVVCVTTGVSSVTESRTQPQTVRCFPNPASASWSVSTDINYESIRIIDVLGRRVAEYPASASYTTASLPRGNYQVQLIGANGSVVGKTVLIRN